MTAKEIMWWMLDLHRQNAPKVRLSTLITSNLKNKCFLVGYLTTLLVLRMLLNECERFGGVRTGAGSEILGKIPPHCQFLHNKCAVGSQWLTAPAVALPPTVQKLSERFRITLRQAPVGTDKVATLCKNGDPGAHSVPFHTDKSLSNETFVESGYILSHI